MGFLKPRVQPLDELPFSKSELQEMFPRVYRQELAITAGADDEKINYIQRPKDVLEKKIKYFKENFMVVNSYVPVPVLEKITRSEKKSRTAEPRKPKPMNNGAEAISDPVASRDFVFKPGSIAKVTRNTWRRGEIRGKKHFRRNILVSAGQKVTVIKVEPITVYVRDEQGQEFLLPKGFLELVEPRRCSTRSSSP